MEYYIIIAASIIIILSYLYNRVSARSNIPAVLLLIITGIIARELAGLFGIEKGIILETFEEIKILEVLGTLGLILIVLEASLELKIKKEKFGLIRISFLIAFLGLMLCMLGIAGTLLMFYNEMTWIQALIYANPLSILSSAIVIPSVVNLDEHQEEFHIYESTFSDILGIMVFYFLLELGKPTSNASAFGDFSLGLVITIITSFVLSYVLIYVFQNLETRIKLFLMISVLFLLFSVGKLMHLSSLLIILIFGLILNNPGFFFFGRFKRWIKPMAIANIHETFLMITVESAFVIRTFFFIIFGFSIALATILDLKVALVSLSALAFIYGSRYFALMPGNKKNRKLALTIAPRGLITLLLFYSIPNEFISPEFNSGILLFVIILTSLVMTFGLIRNAAGLQDVGEVE